MTSSSAQSMKFMRRTPKIEKGKCDRCLEEKAVCYFSTFFSNSDHDSEHKDTGSVMHIRLCTGCKPLVSHPTLSL